MVKMNAPAITALALFVLIVTTYLVLALYYPVAYIWATYEDLYGEWAQTYSYMVACLLSVLLAFSGGRYRWFFTVLAMACLYVFMEEISWGQRLIGFDTPELLKRYNLQREANIHNLLVGPVSTTTKDIVEYVLASALLLYGVLYPLTLKFKWSVAQWFDRLGFAAPPLYLSPFFLTASYLELSPVSFNEAEVAELLVGSALAIMAAHYWVVQRRQFKIQGNPDWQEGSSPRLALIIVGIVVVVGILSTVTTRQIYADAGKRAKIDGRILNGYEKFAKRYSRYERLDIAVDLLKRVHHREPDRTSILRRIATIYQKMDDHEQFMEYNQKALDIALKTYAEDPDKRSTNLSLARTYRQRGENEKSRYHAKHSLDIALAQVEANPDSAHDAYWLAKAYRLTGDRVAALSEYKRAFELRPGSTKYRRAYYSMRKRVPRSQIEEKEETEGE